METKGEGEGEGEGEERGREGEGGGGRRGEGGGERRGEGEGGGGVKGGGGGREGETIRMIQLTHMIQTPKIKGSHNHPYTHSNPKTMTPSLLPSSVQTFNQWDCHLSSGEVAMEPLYQPLDFTEVFHSLEMK